MADTTVARRYARALLELGIEAGNLDQISTELQRFTGLLHANDEQILGALVHPGLLPDERAGFLDAILAKFPFEPIVANFTRLALEKGRADLIPEINDALQHMADEKFGRVRAVLTTATPISDALREEFRAALAASTGKTVILESAVDDTLLGGVTIAVGDKIYDASVRSRLQGIRQSLINASAAAEA